MPTSTGQKGTRPNWGRSAGTLPDERCQQRHGKQQKLPGIREQSVCATHAPGEGSRVEAEQQDDARADGGKRQEGVIGRIGAVVGLREPEPKRQDAQPQSGEAKLKRILVLPAGDAGGNGPAVGAQLKEIDEVLKKVDRRRALNRPEGNEAGQPGRAR